MLSEICRIVISICAKDNVSFTDNKLTGRITFKWKKGRLTFISFDRYFFDHLVLDTEQLEISSKPHYYTSSKIS